MNRPSQSSQLSDSHFTELGKVTRSHLQKQQTLEKLRAAPSKRSAPVKYYFSLIVAGIILCIWIVPSLPSLQGNQTSDSPEKVNAIEAVYGESSTGTYTYEGEENEQMITLIGKALANPGMEVIPNFALDYAPRILTVQYADGSLNEYRVWIVPAKYDGETAHYAGVYQIGRSSAYYEVSPEIAEVITNMFSN